MYKYLFPPTVSRSGTMQSEIVNLRENTSDKLSIVTTDYMLKAVSFVITNDRSFLLAPN